MAVGKREVSRASCTRLSRRLSFVVIVVRSTSKEASVTVVPSMVKSPVTSPVRPTAVEAPIPASSSLTRNPAKVPVAVSKSKSPVSASMVQVPSMALPASVVAVAAPSSTWSTAASRETAAGASSFRYHQRPPPTRTTMTMAAAMRTLAREDMAETVEVVAGRSTRDG